MEPYISAAVNAGQAYVAAQQAADAQRRQGYAKTALVVAVGILALVVMLKVSRGSRR